MVMMVQPVWDCMDAVTGGENVHRIYMSPKGAPLTQTRACELASYDRLVILCGHYEGIDERIMNIVDEEISIGDYVLTGGELPAMVLVDCIARHVDGVLGSSDSVKDESFSQGLLEYPQYTRPAEFRGMSVPEVLLNGNHAEIDRWRREQAIKVTKERRPDILKDAVLSKKELSFLESLLKEEYEE